MGSYGYPPPPQPQPPQWYPAPVPGPSGARYGFVGRAFPTAVEIIAAVVIGLGFAIEAVSSKWRSIDGEIVSFEYIDTAALIAGLIAAALGVASLVRVKRVRFDRRRLQIAAGIAILLFSGLHFARGLGAFAEPPSRATSAYASNPRPVAAPVPTPSGLQELADACFENRRCDELERAARAGCERGDSASCNNLGFLVHFLGRTGKADNEAASAAFTRECERGHRQSCLNLEGLIAEPLSLGGDEAVRQQRLFLGQACDAGNKHACRNLGFVLARGSGPGTQRWLAERCEEGHEEACKAIAP